VTPILMKEKSNRKVYRHKNTLEEIVFEIGRTINRITTQSHWHRAILIQQVIRICIWIFAVKWLAKVRIGLIFILRKILNECIGKIKF
jgi:hypothetical protein